MATPYDDDIAAVYGARKSASATASPEPFAASNDLTTGNMDELVSRAMGKSHRKDIPFSIPFSEGMGRSIVSGATAGYDDELVGLVQGDKAKNDRRELKDQFHEDHPEWDTVGKGAGAVGTLLVPGMGIARLAQGARLASAAVNAGRVAPSVAHATGAMAQGAALAVPYGMANRAGNADDEDVMGRVGEAVSPTGIIADAALGAVGAKAGELIGNGIGTIADKSRRIAEEGRTASALGSRPELYARQSINRDLLETRNPTGQPVDTMTPAQQQAALNQIYSQVEKEAVSPPGVRPATGRQAPISTDAESTIIRSYYNAIDAGADDAGARAAAATEYRTAHAPQYRGRPISNQLVSDHVNDVIDAATPYRAVPLNTAEILSGERAGPIRGQLKSAAQHVANTPGESRAVFNIPVAERVAGRMNPLTGQPETPGSIARTRALINSTLGDGDYLGYMEGLQNAARSENRDAYGLAAQNAKHFDIGLAARFAERQANRAGGQVNRDLINAARMIDEWRTRTASLPPASRLNSYKQMRAALTQQIDEANARVQTVSNPDKVSESGRSLSQIKNFMDRIARRQNPDWWDANVGAADHFAIERAANMGRTLSLGEGASMQQARHWFTHDATRYEQEAFRRGLARRLHDALSAAGDTHDVSKIFLKGGDGQFDEGLRGLLTTVIGSRDARTFIRQIKREQIANSTFKLDKGSQTSALEEEKRNRNYLSHLKAAWDTARSPISSAADYVIRSRAASNSRALDAALGRVLGEMHTGPTSVDRVIADLRHAGTRQQSANAGPSETEIRIRRMLPFFGTTGAQEINRDRASGGRVDQTQQNDYGHDDMSDHALSIARGYLTGGNVEDGLPDTTENAADRLAKGFFGQPTDEDRIAAEMGALRRRVQAHAMAGREPNAADINTLEAYKPTLAARQAGMIGEGAAAVAPYGSIIANGVARAPRITLATLAALGVGTGTVEAQAPTRRAKDTPGPSTVATPQDAQRNSDGIWSNVKGDPTLEALYGQMEEAQRRSTSNISDPNTGKPLTGTASEAARARASDDAANLRAKILSELARRNPPKMSFEKAYPQIADNLAFLQLAAPAALGMGLKSGARLASHFDMAPWRGAVRRADEALDPGFASRLFGAKPNVARAENYAAKAGEFMNEYNNTPARIGRMVEGTTPTIAGTVLGAEMGLFPDQYNSLNAPAGSPEKEQAERRLSTLGGFVETALPGAIRGTLGGFGGSHMSPVFSAKPPIAETKALMRRYKPDYASNSNAFARSVVEDNIANALADVKVTPKSASRLVEQREKQKLLSSGDVQPRQLRGEAAELESAASKDRQALPAATDVVRPETPAIVEATRKPLIDRIEEGRSHLPPAIEAETNPAPLELPPVYRYRDKLGRMNTKHEDTGRFVTDPRKSREKPTILKPASKENTEGTKTIQASAKPDADPLAKDRKRGGGVGTKAKAPDVSTFTRDHARRLSMAFDALVKSGRKPDDIDLDVIKGKITGMNERHAAAYLDYLKDKSENSQTA